MKQGSMAGLGQQVYNRLPVLGQNVAVSAYGLVIKHRCYGGQFERYFRELMDSQWFSEEKIEALQRRKLRDHSRQTAI